MSRRGSSEDVSTILYMVPFLLSGIYGVILWLQNGISITPPSSVYLTVSRDPYVFMAGSLAILLGLVIELGGTEPGKRPLKLSSLGNTLQTIAAASLVLAILTALYANGFTDVSGAADDFVVGRYALVFPAIMVLLSYLITARFKFESLANTKALAMVALLLVPVSIYELGKRELGLGMLTAFVLLLAGVGAYLIPQKKAAPPKTE
jgi:hypothetical protein